MSEAKKRGIYSDSSYTEPKNFEDYRESLLKIKQDEGYLDTQQAQRKMADALEVIFERHDNDKNFSAEDATGIMFEALEGSEIEKEPVLSDISDSAVMDYINAGKQEDWTIELEMLKETLGDNKLLAFGSIGRWDGVRRGWEVEANIDDIFRGIMKDCDNFEIWDENGHLFIEGAHHDGHNQVEIRMLTKKGEEYYENWGGVPVSGVTSDPAFEKLSSDAFSKIPHHAEKAFGCPADEWVEEKLSPDNSLTGDKIQTPRGNFSLTSMTKEQMEAAGYGYHHSSDDGNHLIMGNGTRAFAVAKDAINESPPSLANESRDAREASGELGNNAATKAIDGRDMR